MYHTLCIKRVCEVGVVSRSVSSEKSNGYILVLAPTPPSDQLDYGSQVRPWGKKQFWTPPFYF